jgi:hypothetical protein
MRNLGVDHPGIHGGLTLVDSETRQIIDSIDLRVVGVGVKERTARGGTVQKGEDSEPKREGWFEIQRQRGTRP